MNKYIVLLLILLLSCGGPKQLTQKQINGIAYDDLPAKKQNEFGQEYYKQHPCEDAIISRGSDTIREVSYIYEEVQDDSTEYYKKRLTEIISDTNDNNTIQRLYNENDRLINQNKMLKILAKKIKVETIRITDTVVDMKLLDIETKEKLMYMIELQNCGKTKEILYIMLASLIGVLLFIIIIKYLKK